jgi:hypothetical protein
MVDSKLLNFYFLLIVNGNQNDSRVSTVGGEELIAAKKGSSES